MSMLESGGADQNQEDLLNLLGMESVEFVFTIMEHRDAILHAPEVVNETISTPRGLSQVRQSRDKNNLDRMKTKMKDLKDEMTAKPIDGLGLDPGYVGQLKQQGLRLKSEPKGYDDRYKGYMSGIKLNHDITSDERCAGSKTYRDVGE